MFGTSGPHTLRVPAGQTLLDGYTASFYNAFFTAFPIGIFSVVDRPFRSLDTYMRFPQVRRYVQALKERALIL